MAKKTPVNIFIASSAEVKDEREKCISLVNHIGKSHKHLNLESVEWEYDMVHGSNPGYETIQKAINPLLKNSQLAIFIFHSKIGKYTREEFEKAMEANKRVFAYFKTGFSPDKNSLSAYSELLDFKEGLNDTVLYKEYKDLIDFEKQFYPNLNLYLAETYPATEVNKSEATSALSQSNLVLIRMLEEKDKQITALNEKLIQKPGSEPQEAVQALLEEKEAIRQALLQSEEIRKQQAKEKEELEQRLAPQKEKDALKARALAEVKKGNYSEAKGHLKESAKGSISETASTFFELAKIEKIELHYTNAFAYYELAARLNPENSLYLLEAGAMAYTLGYYNKSIGYAEKSLNLVIKESGEEHPDIAIRYNNLGLVYDSKGEYDKAIGYYEKALALDRQFYGDEHPNIAT